MKWTQGKKGSKANKWEKNRIVTNCVHTVTKLNLYTGLTFSFDINESI